LVVADGANGTEVRLSVLPTMASRVLSPLSLKDERPSRTAGVIVAVAMVAAATLAIYPLKTVAPVVSLGVVYLLAVVVVSTFWGLAFGVGTAVISVAAFNFFHLPPVGRFTLAGSRNWVPLAAFVVVALAIGLVAELARARAREADQRRLEADLSAELARLLLGAARLQDALPVAARRLAATLGVASASIELREVAPDGRRLAFPLESEGARIGTLLLPARLPPDERARVLERVVPSLSSVLAAARNRVGLQAEVVETAALRRADTVKTALLRAVSHDLRSPLTAISTAGEAIASRSLSHEERDEMAAVIQEEAQRLSRLVDNLLDLSRLEAGAAAPHRDSASVEELMRAALRDLVAGAGEFSLSIDHDLPPVRVDSMQMERAFVNVLENARRHSGGHPVSVRARAVRQLTGAARVPAVDHGKPPDGRSPAGDRVIVRVVDRGPGIPSAQLERVFEPFYRADPTAGAHRGSGLGLAIARGFAEANAGSLHVESLPGQGATFVFELPLQEQAEEPALTGRGDESENGALPTVVRPVRDGALPTPPGARRRAT
jgi:two-component system, OmpR family, sensor histidine kinase KdpD